VTATEHLDALTVAELIQRHVARVDYRGDFAGRCACGEPIERGYPGHAEHVARLIVSVLTPEPGELLEVAHLGPMWFLLPGGGIVDLAKAYHLDVDYDHEGAGAVMAFFPGGDGVQLSERGSQDQSAEDALAVLREALG
jgi:hypothetical protein